MDPVLTFDDLPVRVPAGSEARVRVTVRNTGTTTDHFRFEVLGPAARWAGVEPRQVADVTSGDRASVDLVLRPPPATAHGREPVGVRAVSLTDPDLMAVVEGSVVIGSADQVDVVAAPVAASGRHTGRYVLQIGNTGAVEAAVRLSATDPRQELRLALAPPEVTVAPGESERAYLSVRPRRPRLAGGPVVHRFSVEHGLPSGKRDRLSLEFEQRPVLGRAGALGAAVLAVAVVAAAGLLLWPTVRSALAGDDAATTGETSASQTAAGDPVQGAYVIWAVRFTDDEATRTAFEETVAQLQAAGVDARVVSSLQSDRIQEPDGRELQVLLQDGFADEEEAAEACEQHRAIARECNPVGPG